MSETAFVGRERELQAMRVAFHQAQAGSARGVLVVGRAGAGKTRLVKQFLAEIRPGMLLSVSGSPDERDFRWGVVRQLASKAGADWSRTFAGLRRPRTTADPLTIGGMLLDAFGQLQGTGTVVLVVDDTHWVDEPSLRALLFALRRLAADRFMFVLVLRSESGYVERDEWRRILDEQGTIRIDVKPMGIRELRELAVSSCGKRLSALAIRRLRDYSEGSPLHALAALEELGPAVLSSGIDPLPPPRSFSQLVQGRVDRLDRDARRVAEAAAVLGREASLTRIQALWATYGEETLGSFPDAFDRTVASGLVEETSSVEDAVLAFPHPLVRAALYHSIPAPRRHQLHLAAAEQTSGAPSWWHRLRATPFPDEDLGAAIEAEVIAGALGNPPVYEGRLMHAAARHSSDDETRERRLLMAVLGALIGSDTAQALAWQDEIVALADDAWRDFLLFYLAAVDGRGREAASHLELAWAGREMTRQQGLRQLFPLDEFMALHRALLAARDLDRAQSRRRLAELPASTAGPSSFKYFRAAVRGMVRAVAGEVEAALAELDSEIAIRPLRLSSVDAADAFAARGLVRLWAGQLEQACSDLRRLASDIDLPAPSFVPAQAALVLVELRLGQLARASHDAALALATTEEFERRWELAVVHGVAAMVAAAVGDWPKARDHARSASDAAVRSGLINDILHAAAAQVAWSSAAADSQELRILAGHLREFKPEVDPRLLPSPALWAEVLARTGDVEGAKAELKELDDYGFDPWICAETARVRLIAMDGQATSAEADVVLRAGRAAASECGALLVDAQLLCEHGGALLRAGQVERGHRILQMGRQKLAHLGAADRVRPGDEGVPAGSDKEPETLAERLSRRELVVASLVAEGLSNSQVASALLLSVKTVEFHLRNAYRKLGVSSRARLAAVIAAERLEASTVARAPGGGEEAELGISL